MRAVTTGPSTGFEAITPGRQDKFHGNHNPGFRSANLICGTAHFFPCGFPFDPPASQRYISPRGQTQKQKNHQHYS
jgi:hypothetical protein